MFFNINESKIKELSTNFQNIDKGFWMIEKVTTFYYNDVDNTVLSTVSTNTDYHVKLEFSNHGEIINYSCECPDFHTFKGACKHVVAVLFKAIDELQTIEPVIKASKMPELPPVLNLPTSKIPSKKVNLEIACDFRLINKLTHANFSFKIGEYRLYIIKSLQNFLSSVVHNNPHDFGKNFSFIPGESYFLEPYEKVFRFLLDLFSSEKTMLNIASEYHYFNGRQPSYFNGKFLRLHGSLLSSFLSIIENIPLHFSIGGNFIGNSIVSPEPLPLIFDVQQMNEEVILANNTELKILPITEDFSFFFDKESKKIYPTTKKQQEILKVILPLQNKYKSTSFRIPKESMHEFFSSFLPKIKESSLVTVEDSINDRIVKNELITKMYFDLQERSIQLLVKFCYGNLELNPLSSNHQGNEIVIRDLESEKELLRYIVSCGFQANGDYYSLHEEDKLTDFLLDKFEFFKEKAELFYSDSFKAIQFKPIRHISCNINLKSSEDLLYFDLELDNFDAEEISRIFDSVKEKKKYHRLKNGSFVSLASNELSSLSKLFEMLNINPKSFKLSDYKINKSNAPMIDLFVKDSEMHFVTRDESFRTLVSSINEPQDMDFHPPESLKGLLRDYQLYGFKWLKTLSHYGFGGILADDMGLGKTLQILALIRSELHTSQIPSLVVAPTSLIYNWFEESKKFTPDINVLVISGSKKEREKQISSANSFDLVVTSYASIRRDISLYKSHEFNYCIIDEAQHIKNPSTINAGSVKAIKARRYFALTGTPIENSLTELWSIFDFVLPGYLFNHRKFVDIFERPIVKDGDEDAVNKLQNFIRPFILRRLKKDVLKELPEKIESRIVSELSKEQHKLYLSYLENAKKEFSKEVSEKGFNKSQIKILSLLTRLRQICCHPSLFIENYTGTSGKLELLLELIEDSVVGKHKCLIFSQFTSMHDIIKGELSKRGIGYFYIDGATNAIDRINFVSRFNSGEKDVFLISLRAGGTGLNLTGADVVIHFDPWWNPAVEDQATDRAYRIGQDKVVQVFKLVSKGTIEEKIFDLQRSKRDLIDSVIKPGQTLFNKLSEQEMRELFEL